MKQVLQNLRTGETKLEDLPTPQLSANSVIISSRASLISAGTERMLLTFGKSSLLDKVRQQPEKVKQVLEKARTDGLLTTLDAVRSKLDQPIPLGYSNVGIVLAVGEGVTRFKPGDRVVSNGAHAEVVRVPANLCADIPHEVDDQSACFTVVAAIALQGLRLAKPTLGDSVVVLGLGLIGLLAAQLARANGCRVLGIDVDESKIRRAGDLGIQVYSAAAAGDAVSAALEFSAGRGVDAVLITASTQSSEPVAQAARMCRKRGRIILVGVTGLELNRADFYEKELTFQVSCSYGPGRYDPNYEQRGHDYPIGFVRWTAQRNFEAVLSLLRSGVIDVRPLISHRYPFEEITRAYDLLTTDRSALGILLEYPVADAGLLMRRRVTLSDQPDAYKSGEPVVGFLGAGNYAGRVLMPAFKAAGARLDTVVTTGGAGGIHHARKVGCSAISTDVADALSNPAINTVVIATRHDTHARYAIDALTAGKNVFVEKPLALTYQDVAAIEEATRKHNIAPAPRLMVGFNRRFAPLVQKVAELLLPIKGPKAFIYTCNAGIIPQDHWTQDDKIGGGRIIGEACHFIDLLRYLAQSPIVQTGVFSLAEDLARRGARDSAIISLGFKDGSIGSIHYLSNGPKSFPKERLEIFAQGGVLQLDNFRVLRGFSWPGFSRATSWRQDKGQQICVAAFLEAIRRGTSSPIPIEEIIEVGRITIEIAEKHRATAAK